MCQFTDEMTNLGHKGYCEELEIQIRNGVNTSYSRKGTICSFDLFRTVIHLVFAKNEYHYFTLLTGRKVVSRKADLLEIVEHFNVSFLSYNTCINWMEHLMNLFLCFAAALQHDENFKSVLFLACLNSKLSLQRLMSGKN